MGVLYDSVNKLNKETEKQVMIQELLAKGVTENKEGKSIHELSYYDLRHELILFELKKGF